MINLLLKFLGDPYDKKVKNMMPIVEHINKLANHFKEEFPKLQSIKILEDNSVSPDGVIVETLNTRLDSRVSVQIAEIAQKMLTGANNELE